jgi:hypothetical protein
MISIPLANETTKSAELGKDGGAVVLGTEAKKFLLGAERSSRSVFEHPYLKAGIQQPKRAWQGRPAEQAG